MALLGLALAACATPTGAQAAHPSFMAEAASAIEVLQRHWYMAGAGGSWVGRGPGGGVGRYDACTVNASQSCKCNGYQGNWVRANTIEALCSYQIRSDSRAYDDVIAAAWPSEGFEVNAAAPFDCDPNAPGEGQAMPHGDPGWPYYDDILWWALAMLRAADMHSLRGEPGAAANLTARSERIFEHVAARAWNGTEAACGGGIWWSTSKGYKNAIANELFFATAAKLGKTSWAQKVWRWFAQSGMINSQSLINDGLGKDCHNNGRTTFTYNQGVVLGGLSFLNKLTGDASLLTQASQIIDAVLLHLTDSDGVLVEADCGDGGLFKGIFVRYVRYYIDAHESALSANKLSAWRGFLTANAESLWLAADGEGKFPVAWGARGMVFPSGTVNLQTAAIDAFVAASSSSDGGGAALELSSAGGAADCSGAGTLVRGRCVCRTRYTGPHCQQEIGWLSYYGSQGRKVVIMTDSGQFLSSSGEERPNRAVSHVSGSEYWSVQACGAGVGLVDSGGKWLALDLNDSKPNAPLSGLVAEVVTLNASQANCKDPKSPASFSLNISQPSATDEAVAFISAVPSTEHGAAWFLTVDTDGAGHEGVIAVAATEAQAATGYHAEALRFHVRLQQFCQNFKSDDDTTAG